MINNHLLKGVPYIESPNKSGTINPTLLVLHYTASGEGNDAKYFQKPQAKASAHLVIERDGTITQCVPFNKKAWHAGKSIWRGVPNCNNYSIGIEIDNWGLLQKRQDGKFYSHAGKEVTASKVVHAKNKLGNGKYWEAYNAHQLKVVEDVVNRILEHYPSIKEIVGHEDISPRRKIDPGPALYDFVRKLNNNISCGRRDPEVTLENKKVIGKGLRLRTGPTTSHAIIGTVPYHERVLVLYDAGKWSRIECSLGEGWVYDEYLQ